MIVIKEERVGDANSVIERGRSRVGNLVEEEKGKDESVTILQVDLTRLEALDEGSPLKKQRVASSTDR